MDEGELPMDEAQKLTAEYICKNEEWLKIALHVYPIVALDSQSIPLGLSGTASRSRFSRREEAG